jgi:hypothetical protein
MYLDEISVIFILSRFQQQFVALKKYRHYVFFHLKLVFFWLLTFKREMKQKRFYVLR